MKIIKTKQSDGIQYPFLKDYIYKLYIEWNEGEFMALQTKDSQFCLDKYRRLQEQGHKIRIEFYQMSKVS